MPSSSNFEGNTGLLSNFQRFAQIALIESWARITPSRDWRGDNLLPFEFPGALLDLYHNPALLQAA
jgi:hypothetical protein